ncbi:hypothetical protein T265_15632, partial [Opisthorchis viverrini]
MMRINPKKYLSIWVSLNLSFSLHHEKSSQKAFAILRMIRRTFPRITRMDFQILYGFYVRSLPEYANQVVYSLRSKDVTLIERVQRAATKIVVGLKFADYETRLAMLDLFPLENRRPRKELIPTYALFEQRLANRGGCVGFYNLCCGQQNQSPGSGLKTLTCLKAVIQVRATCAHEIVGIQLARNVRYPELEPQNVSGYTQNLSSVFCFGRGITMLIAHGEWDNYSLENDLNTKESLLYENYTGYLEHLISEVLLIVVTYLTSVVVRKMFATLTEFSVFSTARDCFLQRRTNSWTLCVHAGN